MYLISQISSVIPSSSTSPMPGPLLLTPLPLILRQTIEAVGPVSPSDPQNAPYSCNDIDNCRTRWSIAMSCLSTIFLCTWVAVHPNLPEPIGIQRMSVTEKCLHSLRALLSRRIPLFVCMQLVPEYVLAFAIRQWLVATKLSNKHGSVAVI